MEPRALQDELRQDLLNRGFSLVRFTHPPLGDAAARFREWLGRGFAGEMGYLARRREERLDPSLFLESLRSMIVVAHPYDSLLPNTHAPDEGNISRYAWGEDYHEVLKGKLLDFQHWLEKRSPGLCCAVSVDASPVLEKGWAERAGLGWIGKHTNLIQSEEGSYFFLAVLLTNLELPEDPPVEDRCGTCTSCISACPTGAIVAPYVLDARLCISYLTIELKGPVPRKLRPLIGNRIFGCDDCQEVCPWNRFSRLSEEKRFYPREGVRNRPLLEFLDLDETTFKTRFAGSAILRPKRRGFLRNVLIAIGNSGRNDWADAVREKLRDPEPLIRGHAVWALGQLIGEKARVDMEKLRATETDPFVLEEISEFEKGLGPPLKMQ